MQLDRLVVPPLPRFAWNLPFLPRFTQNRVQFFADRFELRLELLVNDVDFGVVGYRLECNVGHAFANKSLTYIPRCF